MIVFHCKANSYFFTQDNDIKNQQRKIYIKVIKLFLKFKNVIILKYTFPV